MNIKVAGENSFIIYFAEQASPEVSAQIQQAMIHIKKKCSVVIIELVPSYASLLVTFDFFKIDHHAMRVCLRKILQSLDMINIQSVNKQTASTNKVIELPVYYHESVGLDLSRIAKYSGLSIDQVITKHQAQEYRVYAIGFSPGFAYLGDVDESIAMPRLSTPRHYVPKGAVAIADKQTAIYPSSSPGGWNIIGLCPKKMFDANQEPTMPVQVGDRVKFIEINQQEFLALGGEIA
jgi:KipI family sensor histidine kinase inhibitor